MMRHLVKLALVAGLLLIPGICQAELYVCRGEFKGLPTVSQFFFRDPSFGRPNGCYQVPQAFVESELALFDRVPRLDYLAVNSLDGFFGIAEEKDQAGKDAIDAAIADDQEPVKAFQAELQHSPYCNRATLGEVDALLDGFEQQGDPGQRLLNEKGILRCLIALIRLRGAVD
ncbi:MAG TPA: hypothetical protein VF077_12470 [Nitrospiraceae bacterium]